MKIVECFIQSKTGDMTTCEDTYVYNNHFVGVIDGATNVSGQLLLGKTPGQHAAHLIKEAILDLTGDEDIGEVIEAINHRYAEFYKKLDIQDEANDKPSIRPSASMVLFSKYYHTVWMIGDCQFLYNNILCQNIKHVDRVFGEARSIVMKGELLKGKTVNDLLEHDIGFEHIKPLIAKQYHFQNADPDCSLSYAVMNGFPIPEALIKTYKLPRNIAHVAFASDGYPVVFDTLAKTEAHLEEALLLDPLCINENMCTKGNVKGHVSYDDRTYVKVRLDTLA